MINAFILLAATFATRPALIPFPRHLQWNDGVFHGQPRVDFGAEISAQDQRWLQDSLRSALKSSSSSKNELTFRLDPHVQGEEAYQVDVTPQHIFLTASTTKGLYWSVQTLRQLKQGDDIPCVTINDTPAFTWRGVMLDEARHFLGEKFVKHFLDVMSMYKFNVLHWHLTDDQGWRIEIKSRPELTRIGAWRTEADGTRSAGYYTQNQIREVIAYAAQRNITVVPEIEMPGHSTAAIASYPFLSCDQTPVSVPATWGVFGDVLCPGKESSFAFVGDVVKEVAPLFPSQYIHIGGDEVPKNNWRNCPDCQSRMKTEGLTNEEELQGYFSSRVSEMLANYGRQPIGWDEVLKGGAPPNMTVQIWNDQSIANVAVALGHDVILSPQSYCYLNRSPGELPLSTVYTYDPLQGIADSSRVLGIEAPLWSENITTRNCMSMFLPRGLAVSEIAWSNPTKDFSEFQKRVVMHLVALDKFGIDYGPSDKDLVKYSVAPDLNRRSVKLTAIFGLPSLDLRYTTDGSIPSVRSPVAHDNIEWPIGRTLRVATFKNNRAMQNSVSFQTYKSLAYSGKIGLETPPVAPYTKAGAPGLSDGLLGTHDFHDNIWLGWQGSDLIATCDLGKQMAIHEVSLHCLQEMRSWIMMPVSVRYEISDDGVTWTSYGEFDNTVKDSAGGWIMRWCTVKRHAKTRFVRLSAKNYGKLPAWHNGAGGNAWIFADELSVK